MVGLDMGSNRAWSSATAIYENGRAEAIAVAPGIPSIADQEKRDRVSAGTYQKLLDRGRLHVDADRRVPRVSKLIDKVWEWNPAVLVCDRFRLSEVLDVVRGRVRVVPRVWQWSSASEDIRNLQSTCIRWSFVCGGDFSGPIEFLAGVGEGDQRSVRQFSSRQKDAQQSKQG